VGDPLARADRGRARDTAEHEKALAAPIDRDRHTEVGGPPTGAVPKNFDMSASGSSLPKQTALAGVGTTGGKGMVFAIVVAVLLAIGGGIWALTRNGKDDEKVVTPVLADAGIDAAPELKGQLTIDPVIEGASGYLEGGAARQEIPAITHAKPYRVKVTANVKLHLHLEVPGYSPYDDPNVMVPPNETLLLRPSFSTAPAKLTVTTEPPGVTVTLSGRPLGETPKTFEGLSPGTDLALQLSKLGYQPVSRKIKLEAGKTLDIKETLKETTKFGTLTVNIPGGWAEVIVDGKNLGQNAKAGAPPRTFSLPVGKHQLLLQNPKWKKTLSITIEEKKPTAVTENPGG
jgi:hypothetical protein